MLLKQLDFLYHIRWFMQMCPVASSVGSLKAFPFLNCDTLIASLKSELPTYHGHASNVATEVGGASKFFLWWQFLQFLLWWSQQIFRAAELGKCLSSCANSALGSCSETSSLTVLVLTKILFFKTT